ncbi:hypothetical protein Ciccas_013372, partial [Cichlidogyrus casuarinus]
ARQQEAGIGWTAALIKEQLRENRLFERAMEIGEIVAKHLQEFVMTRRDGKRRQVEERIADLAKRWSAVVDWVQNRYANLQNALLHWRHFEEEAMILSHWLEQREQETS